MAVSRYTIRAERSGRWWVLQALEAPGAISQVARLDQADQIIEAIAFVTGESRGEIELDLRPEIPDAVRQHLANAQRLREESVEAQSRAAEEVRAAARELRAQSLTLRDIGTLMDVSYQRAHQLVNS